MLGSAASRMEWECSSFTKGMTCCARRSPRSSLPFVDTWSSSRQRPWPHVSRALSESNFTPVTVALSLRVQLVPRKHPVRQDSSQVTFGTRPVGKQSCRIDKKPRAARWGFLDPLCQQVVDLLPGTANELGGRRSDIRHPNSYSWDTQAVAQMMQGLKRLHDLVRLPLIVLS